MNDPRRAIPHKKIPFVLFGSVLIIVLTGCSSSFYNTRGVYRTDVLEDYEQALKDFTEAIKLDSKNASAYNNRGYIYRLAGLYNDALKDFSMAIELYPTKGNYYSNRASVYYILKDYKQALIDLGTAIKLSPDYSPAYHNRGMVFVELSRYEEALDDFDKAIELEPSDVESYEWRGEVYYRLAENCSDENMKAVYLEKGRKDILQAKKLQMEN